MEDAEKSTDEALVFFYEYWCKPTVVDIENFYWWAENNKRNIIQLEKMGLLRVGLSPGGHGFQGHFTDAGRAAAKLARV